MTLCSLKSELIRRSNYQNCKRKTKFADEATASAVYHTAMFNKKKKPVGCMYVCSKCSYLHLGHDTRKGKALGDRLLEEFVETEARRALCS